jgi:hypothetical protein
MIFRGEKMNFEEQLSDFLINKHIVDIKESIIKPSIEQIIDDLEDYANCTCESEEERNEVYKQIGEWELIKKMSS